MMRALVLVLGILVMPSVAAAQPPNTNPLRYAVALAEQYWHADPCEVQVVEATPPAMVHGGPAQAEFADGEAQVAAWADYVPPGEAVEHCTIHLNGHGYAWADWPRMIENFQWLCDVVTHELGHFLGHSDSGQTDPTSITYPDIGPETANFNSVPQCRQPVLLWYDSRLLRG